MTRAVDDAATHATGATPAASAKAVELGEACREVAERDAESEASSDRERVRTDEEVPAPLKPTAEASPGAALGAPRDVTDESLASLLSGVPLDVLEIAPGQCAISQMRAELKANEEDEAHPRRKSFLDFAAGAHLFFPSCTNVSMLGPSVFECEATGQLGQRPARKALILFDWDDTLFPTSWIQEHQDLRRALDDPIEKVGATAGKLSVLGRAVAELVHEALGLGTVALVTLAQRPWVKVAIRDFMPEVGAEVARLEIFYAREHGMPFGCSPGVCPWTSMKRRAMEQAMKVMEWHGAAESGPWESLISIGDSDVEKRAAIELGRECAANGSVKWTKTLKLTEHPDVDSLIGEVHAMKLHLRQLVEHQGHKHVHINDLPSTMLEAHVFCER